MARRRRVRVAAGFGAGGRQALLQSLVPTASEKAEQDRARRAVDNQKVAAFNREEITIEELTAYFNDRKTQASSDIERTEIQSLLDNASAADKKRKSTKAYNSAVNALADYKNGQGSYDDAVTALRSAKSSVTDQEQKTAIERLITSAGQVRTERVVNSAVEDYNAGRLDYAGLRSKMGEVLAKETNDQIKTAVTKSMDAARDNENKKVMARANSDYSAGRIGIAEYESALTALRDAPDQKNPDAVTQINASIAMARVNEQGMEDQKAYNRWVTNQTDDATTVQYFNKRMAAEKNPKILDNLGQFAANVQKAVAANAEKAAGLARTAASRASAEADNQLKQADLTAKEAQDRYDSTVFSKKLQAALDSKDPYMIQEAYADRQRELLENSQLAGYRVGAYISQARDMGEAGKKYASAVEVLRLKDQVKPLEAAAKALEGKGTPEEVARAWELVGNAAIRSEASGWLIDPTQFRVTTQFRAAAATGMQGAIKKAREEALENNSDAARHIDQLYSSLVGSKAKNRDALLEAAGINPADRTSLESKKKFQTWIQENAAENVMAVLQITNAGKPSTTNAKGEQTNTTDFEKIDELAETIIDTINSAIEGSKAAVYDIAYRQSKVVNPSIDSNPTSGWQIRDDSFTRDVAPPVALPNPDGTYTHVQAFERDRWWDESTGVGGDRDWRTNAANEDPETRRENNRDLNPKTGIDPSSLLPPVGPILSEADKAIKNATFRNIGKKFEEFGDTMGDVGQFIGDAWEGFVWRDGRWMPQREAAGIDAAQGFAVAPIEGSPEASFDWSSPFQPPQVTNSPFEWDMGMAGPSAPQLADPGSGGVDWGIRDEGSKVGPDVDTSFRDFSLPSTWDSWDGGGTATIEA